MANIYGELDYSGISNALQNLIFLMNKKKDREYQENLDQYNREYQKNLDLYNRERQQRIDELNKKQKEQDIFYKNKLISNLDKEDLEKKRLLDIKNQITNIQPKTIAGLSNLSEKYLSLRHKGEPIDINAMRDFAKSAPPETKNIPIEYLRANKAIELGDLDLANKYLNLLERKKQPKNIGRYTYIQDDIGNIIEIDNKTGKKALWKEGIKSLEGVPFDKYLKGEISYNEAVKMQKQLKTISKDSKNNIRKKPFFSNGKFMIQEQIKENGKWNNFGDPYPRYSSNGKKDLNKLTKAEELRLFNQTWDDYRKLQQQKHQLESTGYYIEDNLKVEVKNVGNALKEIEKELQEEKNYMQTYFPKHYESKTKIVGQRLYEQDVKKINALKNLKNRKKAEIKKKLRQLYGIK